MNEERKGKIESILEKKYFAIENFKLINKLLESQVDYLYYNDKNAYLLPEAVDFFHAIMERKLLKQHENENFFGKLFGWMGRTYKKIQKIRGKNLNTENPFRLEKDLGFDDESIDYYLAGIDVLRLRKGNEERTKDEKEQIKAYIVDLNDLPGNVKIQDDLITVLKKEKSEFQKDRQEAPNDYAKIEDLRAELGDKEQEILENNEKISKMQGQELADEFLNEVREEKQKGYIKSAVLALDEDCGTEESDEFYVKKLDEITEAVKEKNKKDKKQGYVRLRKDISEKEEDNFEKVVAEEGMENSLEKYESSEKPTQQFETFEDATEEENVFDTVIDEINEENKESVKTETNDKPIYSGKSNSEDTKAHLTEEEQNEFEQKEKEEQSNVEDLIFSEADEIHIEDAEQKTENELEFDGNLIADKVEIEITALKSQRKDCDECYENSKEIYDKTILNFSEGIEEKQKLINGFILSTDVLEERLKKCENLIEIQRKEKKELKNNYETSEKERKYAKKDSKLKEKELEKVTIYASDQEKQAKTLKEENAELKGKMEAIENIKQKNCDDCSWKKDPIDELLGEVEDPTIQGIIEMYRWKPNEYKL